MTFVIRVKGAEENESFWIQELLSEFERYLDNKRRTVLWTEAPINPEEGDIVRADGTLWNPGSGAGYYGYHDGAWRYLG